MSDTILTNIDLDEREAPLTYPQEAETVRRVGTRDYELDEIERLTIEADQWKDKYYITLGRYEVQKIAAQKWANDLKALKLELNAAFAAALLELAQYAPSGGFVAPSNVRRILIGLAERMGVKVEEMEG